MPAYCLDIYWQLSWRRDYYAANLEVRQEMNEEDTALEEQKKREELRKRKDDAWKDALLYISALLGYSFADYEALSQDRNAYD